MEKYQTIKISIDNYERLLEVGMGWRFDGNASKDPNHILTVLLDEEEEKMVCVVG